MFKVGQKLLSFILMAYTATVYVCCPPKIMKIGQE